MDRSHHPQPLDSSVLGVVLKEPHPNEFICLRIHRYAQMDRIHCR
jgi:hypothetical protein